MADYKDREHYIPFRKTDLVELLCSDDGLPHEDRERFRQFCRLISAILHFEYHERLEELKNDYAPFDPDTVTKPLKPLMPEERRPKMEALFQQFDALMQRANFKTVDQTLLAEANQEASQVGLQMYVDFTMFEKLAAYSRGETTSLRTIRHWLFFWRKRQVKIPVFQRLAVIAKVRNPKEQPAAPAGSRRNWLPRILRRRIGQDANTDSVYLKIFKDVPRMDLEMLLPGARLLMPGFQRLKLGGSWVGGLAYLVYSLSTQLLDAVARGMWYVVYGPLIALFGYGYKQWYGYQSTKIAYGLRLSQSLYFQALDSNAGVIHHLLDEAEQQECREAMLAYYYLLRADESGWTSTQLDDCIEEDLERLTGLKVDFEIADGLAKLERHNLVERNGDRYRALHLGKALEALDQTWDNYFKYNRPC